LAKDTKSFISVTSAGNIGNKGCGIIRFLILVFRFTKIREKIIVIIGEKWTEGIVINKERFGPRLA